VNHQGAACVSVSVYSRLTIRRADISVEMGDIWTTDGGDLMLMLAMMLKMIETKDEATRRDSDARV